jgi:hypothetical protein
MIPGRTRSSERSRPPSSQNSRSSSPEGRPFRRVRSTTFDGNHHVGSVSSTLTGSYIASLKNRDFASGNFRRV